jgi:uncharacterized protein YyaL (SSP411 family)
MQTPSVQPQLPGLNGDSELQRALEAELGGKGPDYEPRTHHLHPDGRPKYVNRLIRESSPYLLQHAHNPVNWYPWGDEAFIRAAAENRPVLLSIGYSTCHWCHVMERESFEDEEIATFVNQNYVAIKVDREERPDIDEIYMDAVRMLNRGRGGWPMTLLLTSERQPFYAATYLPPRDGARRGRPGFLTVLKTFAEEYKMQPADLVDRARSVSQRIEQSARAGAKGSVPPVTVIEQTAREVIERHDTVWGGFGSAPKFPRPSNLEFLLRYAHRSGNSRALAAVTKTLDKMIEGGIHDHVGGGFHRYSTDTRWLVPHFEKMLYDNAQLVVVLIEAWQITGEDRYAAVARETLDYLDREMSDPAGGFYSATDADSPVPGRSHQEEGWFFTWTPAEIRRVVGGDEARVVIEAYGITDGGNFEGRNIVQRWRSESEVAGALGWPVARVRTTLESARAKLYAHRLTRPPPLRDDKVLASWNGLALSAFARGAGVLDERYADRARKLAGFITESMVDGEGRLLRSVTHGQRGSRGFADDYAFTIQGLIDLHEATSEPVWLERALAFQRQLDAHHLDPTAGGYFVTPDDGESLLARPKPSYDGAEPSANSVAALNLLRLHELTLDSQWFDRGRAILQAFSGQLTRGAVGVPKLLCALDLLWDRPLQVVIVEAVDDAAGAGALREQWRRSYAPNKVSIMVGAGEVAARARTVPWVAEKLALRGRSTAYVCEGTVCQKPTSDPALFATQLARTIAYADAVVR